MRQIQIAPVIISGPIQPYGLDLAYSLEKGVSMLRGLSSIGARPIDPRELAAHKEQARQVAKRWLQPKNGGGWQLTPMDRPTEDQPEPEKNRPEGAYLIAVMPIQHTLTHKEDICAFLLGGTSYESISHQCDEIRELAKAGLVDGVLQDVNSPGGMVYGSMDCCDKIYALNDVVVVHAIVRDECCSAALLLATTADKVSITQTAEIGSAGVYRLHYNEKGALDKAGVEITAIYAGEHKLSGAYWAPLSKADRKIAQKSVDYSYALFMQKLSRNRNMPIEDVIDTQALIYRGNDAIDVGFADAKDVTYEQALENLASAIQARKQGKTTPMTSRTTRRGNAFGSRAQRSKVMNMKTYPAGVTAAVAQSLAAAPFGQGAELQQLAVDLEGQDTAIYQVSDKSFMARFDAQEVSTAENAALAIDDREFSAKFTGEPQQIATFVPVPVGYKPGASATGPSAAELVAANARANEAEGQLKSVAKALLGKEQATAQELQSGVLGVQTKLCQTMGQLGVMRGKLTPPMRESAVQSAIQGGPAGISALEQRISQGAPNYVPQSHAQTQQPVPNAGSDEGQSSAAGVTTSGDVVTGQAGSISREKWKTMDWTARANVRKTDPAQYEALMSEDRGDIDRRTIKS